MIGRKNNSKWKDLRKGLKETKQSRMLDKAGNCSVIKDHNAIGFKCQCGFQVMSNTQEHCEFYVSVIDFQAMNV